MPLDPITAARRAADLIPDAKNVLVCDCHTVYARTIVEAVLTCGPRPDRVSFATRAGLGCGSCVHLVQQLCKIHGEAANEGAVR
jgi:NAD(P)H-nitrite reductase large subunit